MKIKQTFKNIYYSLISAGLLLPSLASAEVVAGGGIKNPIGVDSIQELIDAILQIVIAIGTPVAVLFLIYAGFKFVTAQGNPAKVGEAREYFMWTLVGIVILLGASLLSSVVSGTIDQLGSGI
ncbi:pilin [Patescibacteria group bacterium]|nr:pilin [Patescibacteria group bacterium]